jgi:hypothetical protein
VSAHKRGNAILRGADDKPLVVLDRVGEGRVAEIPGGAGVPDGDRECVVA